MKAQHTPEPAALRFSADWLRCYADSHDGGKQAAVFESVAQWLDSQADAIELRGVARRNGLLVKTLRTELAAIAKATGSTT